MATRGTLKKQTLLSIIGIILTITCAFIAVLWETVGREQYLYKTVLVASKDINKGDVITADTLTYIKLEDTKIISNPVINPDEIINKAAKQYIPKNAQVTTEFFADAELVLKKDQFVFKVPPEWVLAMPTSIRRQDEVVFCEISKEYTETQNSSTQAEPDVDGNSTPAKTYAKHNLLNDEWLEGFDMDKVATQTDGKVQSPIFKTTVAYVKDSNNREVVNVGTNDRYDGSSQIASVEIIISLKELRALELSLNKGNKFIILNKEH